MSTVETITFNGVRFRRYPDSPHQADRRYYKPGQADRMRGVQALHQEVWKQANGVDAIPEGFHVHHDDHDVDNNDPSNLVLVSNSDHQRHHSNQPDRIEWSKKAIKIAQEAAKAWHASEEGRAWHSQHALTSIQARPVLDLVCDQCGGPNPTQGNGRDRFCSNKCKSAWRRDAGVDDETRTCLACGDEFTVNKYQKSKCCSKKCAWVIRRAN